MAWQGPHEEGVSQSMLGLFLQCPYAFYIYTILGLKDPDDEENKNLQWGDSFHKGLELYIESKDFYKAKEGMIEYMWNEYPTVPPRFEYSLPKMLKLYKLPEGDWKTEQIFCEEVDLGDCKVKVRGKRDAECYNHPKYGTVLGEHKCKGRIYPAELKYEISQDLQCNVYLPFTPTQPEVVFYDLIRIPDTQDPRYQPKIGYDESTEEYVKSLYYGPVSSYGGQFPIAANKREWISQGVYFFPAEEIEIYWERTIYPLLKKLVRFWEHVNQPDFDHEDETFYNEFFHINPVRQFYARATSTFKCPYHSVLTGQVELEDLTPVENYFPEL